MNLNQLFEELAGGIKNLHGYFEIFKNATFSENKSLQKEKSIRFAIDKREGKDNVYIWPAEILHQQVANQIGIPYPHDEIMYGEAVLKSGKWIAEYSFYTNEYFYEIKFEIKQMIGKGKNTPDYIKAKQELNKIIKILKKYANIDWKNKWIDVSAIQKQMDEYIEKKKI